MPQPHSNQSEQQRLDLDSARKGNWKRWGPYLSERQWGTVREDYSADGNCWDYFPHDHARSRAYRWGEDGLLGICDRECRLCFAIALWNGKDPILKERLFGLTGPEGNHGEDVKELYYYLDSSPTHAYCKALYKYPQAEFPYERLVSENQRRGRGMPELEILDTGIFDDGKYFDVCVEYAKNAPDDILIKISVANRSSEPATIRVLPTLWFRNSWSWGCEHEGCEPKPWMQKNGPTSVTMNHATLRTFRFEVEPLGKQSPALLFTENETNAKKLWGQGEPLRFAKDAFHEYVIAGNTEAVNPKFTGTKMAADYELKLKAGESITLRARLFASGDAPTKFFGAEFEDVFRNRIRETDEFYQSIIPSNLSKDKTLVSRQAYAGLLWSKQFYHYVVKDWLDGDPDQPPPPEQRKKTGRNREWRHLFNRDVISMPDKWEYPWYAAWDLAFHMVPMARVDPQFAKEQLVLMLREWYMHPNGQLPAYEFEFSDVNPPVHAWAVWRVYKMTGKKGKRDQLFLARCFQKLLINFTWWVNRKDVEGKNIFGGGFLGLDNIGIFDRSKPLPGGGSLEQADGTAWMAFYCGTMLSMALELATVDPAYEDVASKFFEHFIAIVDAINFLGGTGLWDKEDGFYYDQLQVDGKVTRIKIRSLVGVIPLLAVEILEKDAIDKLPGFAKRMQWFIDHRKDLSRFIAFVSGRDGLDENGDGRRAVGPGNYLLAIPSKTKLERVLKYLLDENEFLSPHGLRSLSRVHKEHPFTLGVDGADLSVHYTPGESDSSIFGGNSNWRGPIWFPINFLLLEALERYDHYYGDSCKVEFPTGSGNLLRLREVSNQLSARLANLFVADSQGRRPCHGADLRYADDPWFKSLVLYYEHFHGDNGRGIGASHQTGWTALVTRCLEKACESPELSGAAPGEASYAANSAHPVTSPNPETSVTPTVSQ